VAICNRSIDSENPFGAGCALETGHAGAHVGAQGERLDNQIRATCRAQYTLNNSSPWDCLLPENHAGPHQDADTDTWDVTYRDPEPGVSQRAIPFVMNVRPVQDQVTDLATRVGLLEAAWKIGGETLKEWVERHVLGIMEQIRTHEHQPGAVLIDPAELGSLLKDREELHELRNQAQAVDS
jgi:hypothetical protein